VQKSQQETGLAQEILEELLSSVESVFFACSSPKRLAGKNHSVFSAENNGKLFKQKSVQSKDQTLFALSFCQPVGFLRGNPLLI
jgi:hypothetical protein